MCAPVARIAHLQARTRRDRPIWSPTFSISRMWVTRSPFETQSDQMAAVAAQPVATGRSLTTSSLFQPWPHRARTRCRPTDQSQEPDIENHGDQIAVGDDFG